MIKTFPRVAVLTALVLGALVLGAPTLAAQDQLVKQALKKIASAETGLQTLSAGDVRAANRLLADLRWANKRLKAAYKKNTVHWKDAAKRLAAADAAIRAKAAATPGGQPSSEGGKGASPGSGKGAGANATPSATGGPVIGERFEKLQQLSKEVNNGFNNLKMLNKTFMGDAYRVGSTTQTIAKLKARLAEFPSSDKNVKIVAANLEKFEKLFDLWKAEFKADSGVAKGLLAKLGSISEKYSSKAVPGPIYWPFELEKLTIWAQRTQKLLGELPADIAFIRAATGNSIVGKKAKSMLHWVGRTIPNRLEGQVQQVRHQCNGAVADSLRTAKSLREIKPDDKHAIVNRVLMEGALDRSMQSLQKGLEAVDLAAALDRAIPVDGAPDRAAQRQEIESTVTKLRMLAKSALTEVRMPKALKADDKTLQKLTKIAQETLSRKKYGVHPIQRLVVTSNLQRKEKKEGTIRGTTTGATVTTYHYVWDEYRVVTAEKIGDEVWIFHNVLKYFHSSDSVTPQDVWILSRRFQSTQILPANLNK